MDIELGAAVDADESIDCAAVRVFVAPRAHLELSLVPEAHCAAQSPIHGEFDDWHPHVESHGVTYHLTHVKEPVCVKVLVDAICEEAEARLIDRLTFGVVPRCKHWRDTVGDDVDDQTG